MTTFPSTAVHVCTPPADATRRVNYTLGMILSADDFEQEYAYLAGRDDWLARDALGYGTLSGLAVSLRNAGAAQSAGRAGNHYYSFVKILHHLFHALLYFAI